MTPAEDVLLRLMPGAARGPKRSGLFALWLVVRTMLFYLQPAVDPARVERARKRHVAALERRLSSLSLAPSLRRALHGAVAALRDGGRADLALALDQLVAPAADNAGAEAAKAIATAVAAVKNTAPETGAVFEGEGRRR